MRQKAQISIEYLIIIGFLTFVIIGILGIAFFYSGSIKDRLKIIQLNNFANTVISSSELVFYYGEPSKTTFSVYLPENVKEIEIDGNYMFVTLQTNSGIEKNAYESDVPLSGEISINSGLKKIQIIATETNVVISQI